MKKKSLLTALIVPALLASCGEDQTPYDASGIFEATEVIVSAEATGRILSFEVEEGQELSAGTAVGSIDTLQLSLRRDQLRATQAATNSRHLNEDKQLAALRQQIENLQHERRRFEGLLQEKAATQKQVDDIKHQIEVLQRQLAATGEQVATSNNSLEAQSRSLEAQLSQTDDAINNAIITSPVAGTVLTKYAECGEYATPGKPLFKLGDLKNMKLRAYITAGQLTGIRLGQKATVYADMGETDRKAYEGRIVWISSKAEFTPKTIQTRDERANLVYAIKVEVKNDGLIKNGMYGDVDF